MRPYPPKTSVFDAGHNEGDGVSTKLWLRGARPGREFTTNARYAVRVIFRRVHEAAFDTHEIDGEKGIDQHLPVSDKH